MNDKITKLKCGLDLIIVNVDAYEVMCHAHEKNRSNDVQFEAVHAEWLKHCLLTKGRARHILSEISAHNLKNTSRQIRGRMDVVGGVVKMTINDLEYDEADYTRIVTNLRYLGLRVSYT